MNSTNVYARKSHNQKQIEVSLRMIGHQVLLSSGDSNSRVLPIVEDSGIYRIEFGSDFSFNPEILVAIINRVVEKTQLARNYIVEVEDCKSGEIVYGFKVEETEQKNIIPCQARLQPRSCYSILFTIMDTGLEELAFNSINPTHNKVRPNKGAFINYIYASLPITVLSIILFIWIKRKKTKIKPHIIALGDYEFDQRNTTLTINNQKIELTGKESELLKLLYQDANSTVEKERILNLVWGDEGDYVGRTLDVFISKLRKKLEFDANLKIVNIRGVGYKLVVNH